MFNQHIKFLKKAQVSPEALAQLLCQNKCTFCTLKHTDCNVLGSPCQKGITLFLKQVAMNPKPELIIGDVLIMQNERKFLFCGDDELIEVVENGKSYGEERKYLSECDDEIVRIERMMLPATQISVAKPQKVVVWKED